MNWNIIALHFGLYWHYYLSFVVLAAAFFSILGYYIFYRQRGEGVVYQNLQAAVSHLGLFAQAEKYMELCLAIMSDRGSDGMCHPDLRTAYTYHRLSWAVLSYHLGRRDFSEPEEARNKLWKTNSEVDLMFLEIRTAVAGIHRRYADKLK